MYKRADELHRGEVMRLQGLRRKIIKIEKLIKPGTRLEVLHVRVIFTKHDRGGEVAVFPPSEMVEVGLDGE